MWPDLDKEHKFGMTEKEIKSWVKLFNKFHCVGNRSKESVLNIILILTTVFPSIGK